MMAQKQRMNTLDESHDTVEGILKVASGQLAKHYNRTACQVQR
jgi:hypothetical protein